MDLAEKGKVGTAFGKFKGVNTFFSMAAALMVFLGFRFGVFHFGKGFILPFAIGAAATAAAVVLLARMAVSIPRQSGHVKSHKLLFRRAYMPYYMAVSYTHLPVGQSILACAIYTTAVSIIIFTSEMRRCWPRFINPCLLYTSRCV